MENRKYRQRWIAHTVSMPIIWAVLIPLVLLDIFLEIYHRTCFTLYRIPYIERKNYIRIDRHKLRYLNVLEKLGCVYCGYANGLIMYAQAIAAETENYWCGIQHKRYEGFVAPAHHAGFTPYGDEATFHERYG